MRTDEHRNEVIAVKCTVTALPFTKRSPPAYYTPSCFPRFGDTTHLSGYREGTIAADGNCSRGHRKVRSAIDWTADDSATFSSLRMAVACAENICKLRLRITVPHRGTRSLLVRVGRNETQIRKEDDIPQASPR